MVKMGYLKTMYWVTAWEFKNVSQTLICLSLLLGNTVRPKTILSREKKEDKQKP